MSMRLLLASLSLVLAVAPARADAPRREACGDAAGATLAVKLAFSDLVRLHRARIPGPSGQQVLDARVDELMAKLIDLDRFAAAALSPMWDELDEGQRAHWSADLRTGLRGRYLRRLTGDRSPAGQWLEVVRADVACDRGTVDFTLGPRGGRGHNDVTLRMVWTGLAWRAYDVTVDGVSLLETWRSRFRTLYKDGGVAAVDEHLRELAQRYRAP